MDELRKNLKFIIIIIVLILLYVVVAVFINNKSNANTSSTDNYLLIGDDLIWHEKGDGQWYQVKKVNDNLVNREFIVYNDVCYRRRQQGDGRKQHEHEYGVSFTYKQPRGASKKKARQRARIAPALRELQVFCAARAPLRALCRR